MHCRLFTYYFMFHNKTSFISSCLTCGEICASSNSIHSIYAFFYDAYYILPFFTLMSACDTKEKVIKMEKITREKWIFPVNGFTFRVILYNLSYYFGKKNW